MKKISSKEELEQYQSFVNDGSNYDLGIQKLPEALREVVLREGGIFPKHLTTELFQELLIKTLLELKPGYKIDSESENIINLVSQYFARDENFLTKESRSFYKGLLIMGRVGCGKTILFKGISNLLLQFRYKNRSEFGYQYIPFTILNSYQFSEGFSINGYKIFDEGLLHLGKMIRPTCARLIIDDCGSENICSHFGSQTNVIAEVILRRYDSKVITDATTNLDSANLKSFYGDRAYSRMREMMNFLKYEGNDRRN